MRRDVSRDATMLRQAPCGTTNSVLTRPTPTRPHPHTGRRDGTAGPPALPLRPPLAHLLAPVSLAHCPAPVLDNG